MMAQKPGLNLGTRSVMDTKSTTGESILSNTTEQLENYMSLLRKSMKTQGGQTYVMLGERSFKKLEELVEMKMQDETTSLSPTKLIALNEEIQNLRNEATHAQDARKAAEATIAAYRGDIQQLKEAHSAQERINRPMFDQMNENLITLERDLAKLKNEKEVLSGKLEKAKRTASSPDEVKEALDELNERRSQITELGREKNAIKATLDQKQVEMDKALKKIAHLEEEQLLKDKSTKFVKTDLETLVAKEKIKTRPIDNQSKVMRLVGKKGVEWLVKMDEITRSNVRDRAFHLMTATYDSNNKVISGVHDILKIIFDWVKQAPMSARNKIQKFLDVVEDHIRTAKVKTLDYYRDLLKEVVEKERINLALGNTTRQGKHLPPKVEPSTSDHAKAWAQVLWGRSKRATKKTGRSFWSFVKRGVNGMRKCMAWLTSWFSSVDEEKQFNDTPIIMVDKTDGPAVEPVEVKASTSAPAGPSGSSPKEPVKFGKLNKRFNLF